MKVCPQCNESFGNELNFCDVDGAKLKRQTGEAASASEQSKVWPLLGVGLLLGALVLSALTVFMPKPRLSPTSPLPSSSSTETASLKPSGTESESSVPAVSVIDEPVLTPEEIALIEQKKRERAAALAAQNAEPAPDPKAAAVDSEEAEKTAEKTEEVKEPPPSQPPTPEPPPKVATEKREREAPPKAVPAVAESKEVKKPDAKATGNKKKSDEKDKEKKGGFMRVFKKIFGKD
jgi:hypothetical protein